jgi:glyoxylase-like metal-dependent hydrolase (beta-lactamase superfamily II)
MSTYSYEVITRTYTRDEIRSALYFSQAPASKEIAPMVRRALFAAHVMFARLSRGFILTLAMAGPLLVIASPCLAQRDYSDVPIVANGKTIKISSNVYVIPDENRRGVPNVGIIVGTRATLIVDPGMGLKSGEAVMREVTKLSKSNELIIVNTHFHPEHTTGEAGMPASAKIIRAAAQQRDIEEEGMKFVKMFASRSAELTELLKDIKGFRAPAEVFERERTVDLGGVQVRLLWLGPGHTRGDTAIFVEGDNVLFSGDLAMKDVFPAFTSAESSIDTWLASLGKLASLGAQQIVGAHYGMGDISIVKTYTAYFTELKAQIVALKAKGLSADDAARMLRAEFHRKYPNWDQPLRVHATVTATYARLP